MWILSQDRENSRDSKCKDLGVPSRSSRFCSLRPPGLQFAQRLLGPACRGISRSRGLCAVRSIHCGHTRTEHSDRKGSHRSSNQLERETPGTNPLRPRSVRELSSGESRVLFIFGQRSTGGGEKDERAQLDAFAQPFPLEPSRLTCPTLHPVVRSGQ